MMDAPGGFIAITVPDHVFEQIVAVMTKFECDSSAEAVSIAATVALKRDEAQLAQILTDLLAD